MKAPLLAAVAAVLLAAPATAAAATPSLPMILPGDATAASVHAARSTWIVGARPGAAARRLAARFGARHAGPPGTGGYVLARARARAFAAALRERGLLVYAQPNTLSSRLTVANDPLSGTPYDWRALVVDGAPDPPPASATSPLIALVDAQLDAGHPEFAGGRITTTPTYPVTIAHGTATASVAAAPVNGRGIVGIWPGARALNLPLPDTITCADSGNQIAAAIRAGAAAINMSYGSQSFCALEYAAIEFAVARGIVPVAAAGNEFDQGNPAEFPASLPHVLTVASVGPDLSSSYFSNANTAIDLSAPGERIMTAVPPALDEDATKDGYELQDGTSFSAPMVTAAAAWLRAARPALTGDQITQALRLSARDLAPAGWDPNTGFGVLSIRRALAITPPPPDPLEPNDGIIWVDGSLFDAPAPLIYKGKGHRHLTALLDVAEDPVDVYRIRLRAHSRRTIVADPARKGDVALAVYPKKAKSLEAKPLKRSSHRKAGRKERIVLRNRGRRPHVYYVSVRVQPRARFLDAVYSLRVG